MPCFWKHTFLKNYREDHMEKESWTHSNPSWMIQRFIIKVAMSGCLFTELFQPMIHTSKPKKNEPFKGDHPSDRTVFSLKCQLGHLEQRFKGGSSWGKLWVAAGGWFQRLDMSTSDVWSQMFFRVKMIIQGRQGRDRDHQFPVVSFWHTVRF